MNNLFHNNSLLSKLCLLLEELTDNEDKEVIAKIIKKQMPENTKYNFSLSELSSVTKREIGAQAKGVYKSRWFATNFLYSLYKIDFEFTHEENNILSDLMDDKWNNVIEKMTNDFRITRALIYKTIPFEIRIESIEAFDLYLTNVFIDQYLKIKKEYDLLTANPTATPPFNG
jgi:hypothetical protein